MKKAIVAMGLALCLIVGNIAVYADTKQENTVEKKATKLQELSSLKDNNYDLMAKADIDFFEGVPLDYTYKINLNINGMQVYSDSFAYLDNGTVADYAWVYKEADGTIMIPLYGAAYYMGASDIKSDDKTFTAIKDNKKYVFKSDSDVYTVTENTKDGEKTSEFKLRHNAVLKYKENLWHVPFWDLVKAFNMNVHVDRSPKINTFNKKRMEDPDFKYVVQVLIWDKGMKMFRIENTETKKLIKNLDAWNKKREDMYDPNRMPVAHYMLLDTKSNYRYRLIENEDGTFAYDCEKENIEGYASLVKDGIIEKELLPDIYDGNNIMFVYSPKVALKKTGKPVPFRITSEDFHKADYLAIHAVTSNVITLIEK